MAPAIGADDNGAQNCLCHAYIAVMFKISISGIRYHKLSMAMGADSAHYATENSNNSLVQARTYIDE